MLVDLRHRLGVLVLGNLVVHYYILNVVETRLKMANGMAMAISFLDPARTV